MASANGGRGLETLKKSLAYIGRIVLVAILAYGLGFLFFATTLPHRPTRVPHADAVVTLTGGDARLDTAVWLLENGAAKRLLITGVHPSITKPEIKEIAHGGSKFDCRADLDFTAEDIDRHAVPDFQTHAVREVGIEGDERRPAIVRAPPAAGGDFGILRRRRRIGDAAVAGERPSGVARDFGVGGRHAVQGNDPSTDHCGAAIVLR